MQLWFPHKESLKTRHKMITISCTSTVVLMTVCSVSIHLCDLDLTHTQNLSLLPKHVTYTECKAQVVTISFTMHVIKTRYLRTDNIDPTSARQPERRDTSVLQDTSVRNTAAA
jgi:hypothetical protein